MSDKSPTAEQLHKIGDIKRRVDKIRDEWDRLDASGANADAQHRITETIEKLQQQLKELGGGEY